jgi:hypothetical protein
MVPAGTPSGLQTLTLSIGGAAANPVQIQVE